ncbi:MAG: class I SAM-dependent methyltransferase [Rhizobiaceae bacterium]
MESKIEKASDLEWDAAAHVYSYPSREKRHVRLPALLSVVGNLHGKRVLDFGCGEGFYSRRLARLGAEVVGIDFSTKMISIAKRKEHRLKQGIEFSICDVREFRTDKLFSIVVSDFVLNTLSRPSDLKAAIERAYDALEPLGLFVVTIGHPARVYVGDSSPSRGLILPEDFDYFSDFTPLSVRQSNSLFRTAEWTNFHVTFSSFVNLVLRIGFRLDGLVEMGVQPKVREFNLGGKTPKYVQYSFCKPPS